MISTGSYQRENAIRLANAMRLGQRLHRERQRLNWSQERLAEAIGTTSMSIHRWEHGQAVPQAHYRERLCQVFNFIHFCCELAANKCLVYFHY